MDFEKARQHLYHVDPILSKVISQVEIPQRQPTHDYFFNLVDAIISQQLSMKSANTILTRFKKLFKNQTIDPEILLNTPDTVIRSIGISRQKVAYLKNLANHVLEGGLIFEQFDTMTDEEIVRELMKVKGIGRWTAEMFLIFAMGRPDVFSYGDLGLRKAIQKLYGFEKEPTIDEATKIAEKWRPYRTLACRYLWKSLEV